MASRIFRNIRLKIFALLLAIVTWWGVQRSMETTENFTFKVVIELPPDVEDVKILSIKPEKFTVTVSGPIETIKAFRYLEHKYVMDLKDITEGKSLRRPIRDSRIQLLPKMKVVSLSPQDIDIDLDKFIQKGFPVEVQTTGDPAPGYRVTGEEFVSPRRIFLNVPRRKIGSTDVIKTAPIDITGGTANIHDKVALIDPLDKEQKRTLPILVDVVIFIRPELVEKKFESIPVHVMRRSGDMREVTVEDENISVTIRGRADIMETFDKSKIRIYIDITDQAPGEYTEVPIAEHIDGIESIVPESVKYEIKP